MGPYKPAKPLAYLIGNLDKGLEFARDRGKTISDTIVVSKGITLLTQTATFNDDIQECRQQPANLKTWAAFKVFFCSAH